MPADPPALAIAGLTKRFGKFEAVSNLSLEVACGQVYAFLGPNGAGKTTTIKSVVGLLQPEAGRITVFGAPVEPDALPFRRLLGYVADRPFLYEKLTAWEHLEFLAGVHRLKKWQERADDYLHLFKLTEWRHQLIEGYSHGMRQKLVLTGALLHEPKLLIVDEPMVGLDPRSSRDVKDLFGRLASSGMGLFLSTHSLETATQVADKIGILHHGALVAEGSFAQLQERASQPGSSLEEVFLKLTEEEAEFAAPGDGA